MEKSNEYAVQMKNISKKFGDFYANRNITLELKTGEIHALLGENGAGKSTLMNLLFGIYTLDKGQIFINEKHVKINNPNDANKYNIAMVHQHFKLVDAFTVLENITLGSEKTKGFNKIDNTVAKNKLTTLINQYSFNLNLDQKVSTLEVGEQQKVEILKMLYKDAEILIFDEPTGALTPQEAIELIQIINLLKKQGKSIIIITHKLKEIKSVADRCTIIRKGKSIDTVNVSETSEGELAVKMVGREVNFDIEKSTFVPKETVLKVENLDVSQNNIKKLSNCNFEVRAGEILGIAGVEGNGQSQIIDSITGLLEYNGNITFLNKPIDDLNIKKRNELGIAVIPQDRQKHGLILDFTLYENIGLKYSTGKYSKSRIVNYSKMKKDTENIIEDYDIRTPYGINGIARDLSGGNQQKLIIGREIQSNPKLLIAAQPTRGVDVGAIENIHKQIISCRDNNMAVLLISLELDEIMKLSDRVIVMHGGQVMGIVDPLNTTQEQIGLLMAGKELS